MPTKDSNQELKEIIASINRGLTHYVYPGLQLLYDHEDMSRRPALRRVGRSLNHIKVVQSLLNDIEDEINAPRR